MPNTMPAIDCPEHVRLLKGIIEKEAVADVFIAAAITKGREGKALTDFSSLKNNGVIALSDDGASVDCGELMREALTQSKRAGLLVIAHCEDKALAKDGVVNLGFTSTRLGLRGISNASEYKRVERDIRLAEETQASLHIAHVSCRESVALIAQAKQKGIKVTAETAPHYFALTEEAVLGYDTNMKMNPPLRSAQDAQAIKEALADGTIDAIGSDHAPHTESEKEVEFARAEFGVVGLETILSASITALIENGVLGWKDLVSRLASNPARILGIQAGTLGSGAAANIIIVSPEKSWRVEKGTLVSKSKNSAFLGKTLWGVVEYTIYKGEIVYRAQD